MESLGPILANTVGAIRSAVDGPACLPERPQPAALGRDVGVAAHGGVRLRAAGSGRGYCAWLRCWCWCSRHPAPPRRYRGEADSRVSCPRCQHSHEAGPSFCTNCGWELSRVYATTDAAPEATESPEPVIAASTAETVESLPLRNNPLPSCRRSRRWRRSKAVKQPRRA